MFDKQLVFSTKITKANQGIIDPYTKAFIKTKASKYTGKLYTQCQGISHYAHQAKNHIYGLHYILLGLVTSTYNFTNLGWEIKEIKYDPYTIEIKGIYWLQIPKLMNK